MTSGTHSLAVMERARELFPGGVNSPVRAFRSVGGHPIVFKRGAGAELVDADGHSYIDFCSSWGPLILGYSHRKVVEAVTNQAQQALSFGAPCEQEVQLAEKLQQWVPGMEMMRFVNSGTEATMSAIRVARSFTGRNKLVKFVGCYHGHSDCLLVEAGSGLATLGTPSSSGVPQGAVQDTLTIPYNNPQALEQLFAEHGNDIAAVIVEPMAANMGLVLPQPGYLEAMRELTSKNGSLLIFDEVMTGFRVAKGGAAEAFGVTPDMWTFGKIVGGGLPAAAYGGRREIMQVVSPLGTAYQAGTLSGNPLAMAAGLATLETMEQEDIFAKLEGLGKTLDSLVEKHLASKNVAYVRKASFFCFFFGNKKLPTNFAEVSACNMELFNKVYHELLKEGIYLGPSGYEVGFLSLCHTQAHLEKLVATIAKVLEAV